MSRVSPGESRKYRASRAALISVTFISVALAILSGCSSLFQKAGEVVEGSAFTEKTLESYVNWQAGFQNRGIRVDRLRERKGGAEYVAITLAAFPALRIRGTVPDGEGAITLSSLEFCCSNLTGWNEFSLGLSGIGRLRERDGGLTLELWPPLECLDITEGRIRRNSTRIAGDQALTALRNRYERILVLTEWMRGQEGASEFSNSYTFDAYWKPILFPEMVSPKRRPPAWTGEGAVWSRGEDIRWNRSYTEGLLREELRPVRNSGTLLRDWEEALDWIYLQYQWEGIIQSLEGEIQLARARVK